MACRLDPVHSLSVTRPWVVPGMGYELSE